jgi:hypothetical protein
VFNLSGLVPIRTPPIIGAWKERSDEKEIVISVEGSFPTAKCTWRIVPAQFLALKALARKLVLSSPKSRKDSEKETFRLSR